MSDYLERQSKAWIVLAGVLVTALVGVADYFLPADVTLFAFYLAIVLFVAWYAGGQAALLVALASVGIWSLAETRLQAPAILAWRGVNRFVAFVIVAFGGAAMRAQRRGLRERINFLERARELEAEIVRAGEREQSRIGRDLHDGLCQQLVAIDFAVACLQDDIDEHLPTQSDTTQFIHQQLRQAIIEARNLAKGVFPVQITAEGFVNGLSDLVDASRRLQKATITLEAPPELKVEDPSVALHLYRIAQEALSNTFKHARATEVSVCLQESAEVLTLQIRDNGVGLSPTRAVGMGSRTMKYRADAIGASLAVESCPQGGTTVTCTWPRPKTSPLG